MGTLNSETLQDLLTEYACFYKFILSEFPRIYDPGGNYGFYLISTETGIEMVKKPYKAHLEYLRKEMLRGIRRDFDRRVFENDRSVFYADAV